MKDGESLVESSPEIILSKSDDKHSLLIVSVSEESVGEYSCTAKNSLGEATATADISGDAHPAEILSNTQSDYPHKFALEWSANSESVIDMFEVNVKKEGEKEWKKHEVKVNEKTNKTNENMTGNSEYVGTLWLTDLEAATKYEVTVASKNKFGLNSHGDIFIFTTKAEDHRQSESIYSPKQQPSVATSSSRILKSSINLSILSLSLLLSLLTLMIQ